MQGSHTALYMEISNGFPPQAPFQRKGQSPYGGLRCLDKVALLTSGVPVLTPPPCLFAPQPP